MYITLHFLDASRWFLTVANGKTEGKEYYMLTYEQEYADNCDCFPKLAMIW